jgi:hypothetical protein
MRRKRARRSSNTSPVSISDKRIGMFAGRQKIIRAQTS